jgi:hypothetical protein
MKGKAMAYLNIYFVILYDKKSWRLQHTMKKNSTFLSSYFIEYVVISQDE